MKIVNICNKIIEYSFYLLFFLVPLALTGDTSELFEFNKLWVTFIITIIIGAAWFTKMVAKREIKIQRTPLDIPILLFLASEIISSFISLDPHTSFWGYYSRFNGGLFSIISFIFLYYAFATNMLKKDEEEDNSNYNFGKNSLIFIGALAVFVVGILISAALKSTTEAGFPYQMLATLITAITSFFVFMKASPKGVIKKSLYAIFSSAVIVVFWGLPSHFGYDPTCLLFRGRFDVSCWTADFLPKVRIFSTLGQPDWLAAYLGTLIPVFIAIFINFIKDKDIFSKKNLWSKEFAVSVLFFVFFILTYSAFLYTRSRTAIAGLWVSLFLMLVFYLWFYIKPKLGSKNKPNGLKLSIILVATSLILTFFIGLPGGFLFAQINNFTWPSIQGRLAAKQAPAQNVKTQSSPAPTPAPTIDAFSTGITDSSKIRSYVWEGAIKAWENNPIFGTGVETFAFAYYQYRPAAHNMTSEWNYLYNKAHNEFLNYLATTGTVGIVTYLLMIGGFYYITLKHLYRKRHKLGNNELLIFSLLTAYAVINITNFGGFSVVIINIFFYLFLIFAFYLAGLIDFEKSVDIPFAKGQAYYFGNMQKISAAVVLIIAAYFIYTLVNYWNADRYYYYGYNYDRTGDYQKAYTFLKQAVDERPGEPTFQDEFAYNNAILGASILAQEAQAKKDQQQQQNIQIAQQLIGTAIATENKVTADHPNNVVFWKTKIRILYTLAQIDPTTYMPQALEAIKKAASLAPTDADVSYNLGVLYGQNGDFNDAISTLENTAKLKPDYKNGQVYYALAIFYHQLAVDKNGKVVNQSYNQKAIDELKFKIKNFGPDQQSTDALKAWEK